MEMIIKGYLFKNRIISVVLFLISDLCAKKSLEIQGTYCTCILFSYLFDE
jgi:hypothetical protein